MSPTGRNTLQTLLFPCLFLFTQFLLLMVLVAFLSSFIFHSWLIGVIARNEPFIMITLKPFVIMIVNWHPNAFWINLIQVPVS